MKFLSIKPGENVAMVDYYTTKIEFLKGSKLTVFDDRFEGKRKDISILPLSAMPKQFPDADVVIVPPVLRHVMEGAGTTLFKKFCKKIAFVKN